MSCLCILEIKPLSVTLFANIFSLKVAQSCLTLCDPKDCRLLPSWNTPGKNTRVGSYFLLQGIFPTQESNMGFLHCRKILYHLTHQWSKGHCIQYLIIIHNGKEYEKFFSFSYSLYIKLAFFIFIYIYKAEWLHCVWGNNNIVNQLYFNKKF